MRGRARVLRFGFVFENDHRGARETPFPLPGGVKYSCGGVGA